jgi:hypothetical protein
MDPTAILNGNDADDDDDDDDDDVIQNKKI